MSTLWNREPVAVLAVVQAGLALAIGFGAHVTLQQMALVMAFASALIGVIVRTQVSPKGS